MQEVLPEIGSELLGLQIKHITVKNGTDLTFLTKGKQSHRSEYLLT